MSETLPQGLSIVIPVYNSEASLSELAARLENILPKISSYYEIVFVNDGSADGSWALIERLAASNSRIRGLCMMRNYGQHNAVLAGIRAARYGTTVTMDDDLQHPPEEIPKLLSAMSADIDVVYGVPEVRPHGFLRNVSSFITKLALQSATGASNARMVSAWRVLRTDIREAFAGYCSPFVSIDVLLTWGTSRFSAVTVPHDQRLTGSSNYTFVTLLRHAVNMMTGFSTFPLQVASVIGFLLTFFGVGIFLFVSISHLLVGSGVAGFPFLASAIAIFSGAQLFALGIIGEYLARIHFRVMDRPSYTLRCIAGPSETC